MNESPQNRVFYRATIFFRHLASCYLKHAIISPGSRSTPLVLAAASLPQIKKHTVLDERSAAFLALGIAKATNKPAALICTSGTAVANYYPAVIEAKKSGVPLLLLTADRPARLHGAGANQTINQQHIFADYPVFFKNIDVERLKEGDIQKQATEAFHVSINQQGPIHLNFPFDKPLEPNQSFFQAIYNENKQAIQAESEINESNKKSFHFNDDTLKAIKYAEHPLIIIGQLTPADNLKSIFQLAERLNAPVLTESGVANRKLSVQGFDGFLRSVANQKQLQPDLILHLGLQPASESLLQSIKNWKPVQHIDSIEISCNTNSNKPSINFIEWKGQSIAKDGITSKHSDSLKNWKKAEKSFAKFSQTLLEKNKTLTDGHIYHHLTPGIPEDWYVFIANSFPARDHSLFGRWKTQKIFTNRGASGIDGITSTAMGVNIGLDKPGVLFTGDLSFLHDSNALLNKKALNHPLIVIVINNRGGSLFRMLPIFEFEETFTPYFETPQEADVAGLAASYGVKAKVVESVKELKEINLEKLVNQSEPNLQIIECRTDPDVSMKLRKELWNFELL